MGAYKDNYINRPENQYGGRIEQLIQLLRIVWDGDIISKSDRDELVIRGLAQRINGGFNLITEKGVEYLSDLGIIHP